MQSEHLQIPKMQQLGERLKKSLTKLRGEHSLKNSTDKAVVEIGRSRETHKKPRGATDEETQPAGELTGESKYTRWF